MDSYAKLFSEVFGQIPLSDTVHKYLKDAKVSNIIIQSKKKAMSMDITLPNMIDETAITSLKKEICGRFPYLDNVDVSFSYDIPQKPFSEKLQQYWNNVLFEIERESILCSKILKDSPWQYNDSDGNLTIRVTPSGSFLFIKKGIGKILEGLISSRLKTSVRVVFKEDASLIKKDRITGIKSALKAAIEAENIKNTQQINNQPQGQGRDEKKAPKAGTQNSEFKSAFTTTNTNSSSNFPKRKGSGKREVQLLPELKGVMTKLSEELEADDDILIDGIIFSVDKRETKSGKFLFTFDMADSDGSVTVKFFIEPDKFTEEFANLIKKGMSVRVFGKVQYDEFSKEINVMAKEFSQGTYKKAKRVDNYEGKKRVELHLHTQMSKMDAVTATSEYIKRAKEWGHKALAITDHGVVQAFPEAYETAKKANVKILYGTEAYLIDDIGAVVTLPRNKTIDDVFVVFDIETTGLDKNTKQIIEIGAVKVKNGIISETFSGFVNPGCLLPDEIVGLTGITDDMLIGAPDINVVLRDFLAFTKDAVLAAHNAKFDIGFISAAAKQLSIQLDNTCFCTLEASRTLLPDLNSHKLDRVAKYFDISLENHHRALDDAKATAEIFIKLREMLIDRNIRTLSDVNLLAGEEMDKKKLKYYHAVIFAKNQTGLKNLYELISISHLNYFAKRPRIPKSVYLKHKEGLIIGTACEAGEFYKAVFDGAAEEIIRELIDFYDYLEIQPIGNNMYMLRDGKVDSVERLIEVNKKIVEYGELYNKPVVATCDTHFIDPEDEVFRRIIMAAEGFKDADNQAPLFFRTTEEMLSEFEYLGEEKAKEVVITNTNLIADMCDNIKPIPDETFPPEIPGAEDEIKRITMKKAAEIYGDPLPGLVADRLERELTSIIKNGFSVMYIIAQKLVWNSVENGYLVGSRGSVGSSFVATMAEITEVNPLPPHYYCEKCKFSDFSSPAVLAYAGASGCDMPDRLCPDCGADLKKDGHDIPFETFLGFDGDKEPDIDLNFSGEYQAKAHAYTEELFGTGFVFKAGTIGTLADKTAFGFVKKYMDERGKKPRNAEVNRLIGGLTGIKRTTGQHPGGLMIVPNTHSIYEFCPVQRPADDPNSDVITTHFDYHSISGRLLKLDILGHDVPTIIRMLHDVTGIDPRTVDLGDKDVMSLFTSPKALGIKPEDINGCKTGSLGLPEFGTPFVRQMLMDTQPSTFAELVRISGLSHGTDVWFNNAQDLIRDGVATLKEVIPTRDDIMVFLIGANVEKKAAFKIMENVRKGKGLTEDEVKTLKAADIPEWYIESCKRIKYMFPKGHAVAYVMMTVRIGYFKIHHPYAFYAASFSVKAEDFDYEKMCKGKDTAKAELKRIDELGHEATAKDKNTQTMLELVIEMYARGLKFVPLDLYKSAAKKFIVTPNGLLPPLCSVQGLGTNAAQSIVEARDEGEFISVEDFRERSKITKTVIELLKNNRILAGMPDTNQLTIFNL